MAAEKDNAGVTEVREAQTRPREKASTGALLSVIMPTYNGERYVASALESLRGQEEGLEVLVVDDGSTDSTLDIVDDFKKYLPIRVITPGRVGNWVAVSNVGLREASSEWACFLHQDDLWLPGRMAKLRDEMKKAEAALVLHNAIFIGPDGQRLGEWTCPLHGGLVPSDQFVERLLVQNFVAIPSPVFRRRAAVESGALDETLWFSADWDLWLRLGSRGPVRFIDEILAAFRIHPQSQTLARKIQPNEWEQQLTAVLDRHLPDLSAAPNEVASLQRVARASIAVNSLLSAASRGEPARGGSLALELLSLGPQGLRKYLRDSRITQRVKSRLKLRWRMNDKSPEVN